MNKIKVVGCGPGSPLHLTLAAIEACGKADMLIGAERVLDLFHDVEAKRLTITADIPSALDAIEKNYKDKNVVVLVTGDPGLFSMAASIIRKFGRDACEVIPGISSVQLAFAKLALDWSGAKIISAHHMEPDDDFAEKRAPDKIAFLSGREESWKWVADLMEPIQSGRAIFVCENLGLDEERIRRVDLETLRGGGFSSRSIIIAIKEALIT